MEVILKKPLAKAWLLHSVCSSGCLWAADASLDIFVWIYAPFSDWTPKNWIRRLNKNLNVPLKCTYSLFVCQIFIILITQTAMGHTPLYTVR